MKKYIIAILSLIILTACESKTVKTVNKYGLTRNVKSFTIKTYKTIFGECTKGEIDDNLEGNCICEFTEEGYLRSKSWLEVRDGELTGNIDYKFIYVYGPDGRVIYRYEYSYSGDLEQYSNYEYDNNGKPIHQNVFDIDHSLISTITYIYNGNNKPIKHIYDDKLEDEYDYELNCTYDDNGRPIKIIRHNKERTYVWEVSDNYSTIEINEYGLFFWINGQSAEYIYDEYGNWTSIIIYENSIPITIIEREITY